MNRSAVHNVTANIGALGFWLKKFQLNSLLSSCLTKTVETPDLRFQRLGIAFYSHNIDFINALLYSTQRQHIEENQLNQPELMISCVDVCD